MSLDPRGHQRLALDLCGACGGLWFDAGELGRVLAGRPRPRRDNELGAPVDPSDPLLCKVCRQPMARRGYPGSGVHVDLCPAHGAFLDRGELDELVGRGREATLGAPQPLELAMSPEEMREAARRRRARTLAAVRVDPRTAELARVQESVRAETSSFVVSLFSDDGRCRHRRHRRDSLAWDILEALAR